MNPYEPIEFNELRDRPAIVFWSVYIALIPVYILGMFLEVIGLAGVALQAACEATAGYFDCGYPWMKTYREFKES